MSERTVPTPGQVQELVAALGETSGRHPEHFARFTDDPCLIFTSPPRLAEQTWTAELARSTYFVKSIVRGTVPRALLALVPDGAEMFARAHGAVGRLHRDDPLRWPAAGLTLALLLSDGEVVLVRRSLELAVNPGMWSATVAEGFSLADVDERATLDVCSAAKRGLAEEMGLDGRDPLHEPELLGFTRVASGIDGWNALLVARTHLSLPEVRDRHRTAADRTEAAHTEALSLAAARALSVTATTEALLALLPRHSGIAA